MKEYEYVCACMHTRFQINIATHLENRMQVMKCKLLKMFKFELSAIRNVSKNCRSCMYGYVENVRANIDLDTDENGPRQIRCIVRPTNSLYRVTVYRRLGIATSDLKSFYPCSTAPPNSTRAHAVQLVGQSSGAPPWPREKASRCRSASS